ncbi:MAG: hypothetical protein IBX56_19885 [Methylomicrobium sp.]|nr:hypothetical protein [Methylomicrobium sp.]
MKRLKLFERFMLLLMGVQLMGVAPEGVGGQGDAGNQDDGVDQQGDGDKDEKSSGDKDASAPAKDKDKGESKLSDGEAKLLQELMEKKNSLKSTAAELAQVKEQLKRFEGVNLDEVKALLKERQESEARQLEAKGEWDRLKANLVEQHTAEKARLEEQINGLSSALSSKDASIVELTIGSEFRGSEFISQELTLTPSKAQIIYGSHFEYEDGKLVGYDKPRSASNRTMLIDASGEPLRFDTAMRKLIEMDPDKDRLIKSKVKPGANSGSSSSTGQPRGEQLKGIGRIQGALDGT